MLIVYPFLLNTIRLNVFQFPMCSVSSCLEDFQRATPSPRALFPLLIFWLTSTSWYLGRIFILSSGRPMVMVSTRWGKGCCSSLCSRCGLRGGGRQVSCACGLDWFQRFLEVLHGWQWHACSGAQHGPEHRSVTCPSPHSSPPNAALAKSVVPDWKLTLAWPS